jgi:hypothetical protein
MNQLEDERVTELEELPLLQFTRELLSCPVRIVISICAPQTGSKEGDAGDGQPLRRQRGRRTEDSGATGRGQEKKVQ